MAKKRKYYGSHDYPGCRDENNFYTSDCAHGCDCWMGGSRSGGPDGVDPFGRCPKHEISADTFVEELEQQIESQKQIIKNLHKELSNIRQSVGGGL